MIVISNRIMAENNVALTFLFNFYIKKRIFLK